MLSAVKYFFYFFILSLGVNCYAALNVLIIGDGAAANCNEFKYPEASGVYQVLPNGAIRLASDPLTLSDCYGGSIWMPLGQMIVDSGYSDKVIFHAFSVRHAALSDWLPGGYAYMKIVDFYRANPHLAKKIDFALWYQGGDSISYTRWQYISKISLVIKSLDSILFVNKWLIAIYSGCDALKSNDGILAAQREIANNPRYRRFLGATTQGLRFDFNPGECFLNKGEQNILAKRWFDSMMLADRSNSIFRSESLLNFFDW